MEGAWDRVVEQAKGRESAEEVVALTLDGVVKCAQGKLPESKVFSPFTQLKLLSIADIGLSSLADFPSFSLLERLILSDNRIAGGLEHLVYAGLKSLRELDLSNNRIQAVEDLKPLAQLKLESLDLYECPVTRSADYRARVFGMIKSLRFLDKTDVAGNERPESEEDSEEDDLNGNRVEGEGEEEVEGGWKALVAQVEHGEDWEEDKERDIEGDDNDQFGYEEDEGGSYREEVMGAVSVSGVVVRRVNYEYGSDEVEGEDGVLEPQDVYEASEEHSGEEDYENAAIEGGEEEELASGFHVSTEVERDVHENDEESENIEVGEDDEDDDGVDNDSEEEFEKEVDDEKDEEYGTEYLLQPIGQSEEDEGTSDFEPGDEEEEDEDFDDEHDGDPVKEPSELALSRKRIREETGENEDRSAKH